MTLRLAGSTSGYTEIDAPAVAGSNTLVLPASNGSANQLLKNGSTAGSLEFSSSVSIDSSNRLLVGTSTAPTVSDAQYGLLRTQGNTSSANGFGVFSIGRGQAPASITSGSEIGHIYFTANDGSAYSSISGYSDGTSGTNDYPGRLTFSTTADGASSPTERMRIDNAGVAMFNRTSYRSGVGSNCKFQVTGANGADWTADFSKATSTVANCYGIIIYYEAASPNGAGNEFLSCQDSVGPRLSVRSNGGIANYSANNANLSDRNAKKDITPAAGTWNCIKEWEIVNYRYKEQPDDADLNLGVIAQQVAESCPEVITVFEEAKDDQPEKLGIKEQQMYWMAIKALQEAQVRIEQLEASNADLLTRLTALESA